MAYVVGFDTGCHETFITKSCIIPLISTTVIHFVLVIKMSLGFYNGAMNTIWTRHYDVIKCHEALGLGGCVRSWFGCVIRLAPLQVVLPAACKTLGDLVVSMGIREYPHSAEQAIQSHDVKTTKREEGSWNMRQGKCEEKPDG